MNILFAVTTLTHKNGGVCTQMLDLCKGFRDANIILVADGNDYEANIAQMPNVTFINLPFDEAMRSVGCFFRCYRQLKEICVKNNIEILHINGQRLIPLAWLIKKRLRIPFLWTNHINAIPQVKLFSAMVSLFKFPIISVSSDLKEQLVNDFRISADRIRVITNGVDTDSYPPLSPEERKKALRNFHIAESDYVIAEVARLTYGKGQDLLVRAVHNIIRMHPEMSIKLLFAGTGHQEWFESQVMQYAKENGINCEYLGFQSPREVFGVSDLAVLPSVYEGFALVCTEALAMECPVVRSDSPGHSDMADVTLVHRKQDLDDLTEKLEYAITHPDEMKAKAKAGRIKCETCFNKEEMCNQTMKVYTDIIEGMF